jgi:hypothetical protein
MRYLLVIASMLTVLTVTALAHPGHDNCPPDKPDCQRGNGP